jgi:hypothetical protein
MLGVKQPPLPQTVAPPATGTYLPSTLLRPGFDLFDLCQVVPVIAKQPN